MSIRFAPARGSRHDLVPFRLTQTTLRSVMMQTANDNQATAEQAAFDPVLEAALRHFARHGLAAAHTAHAEAEAALTANNSADFDHWLRITHSFDRRLAQRMERELQFSNETDCCPAMAAPTQA